MSHEEIVATFQALWQADAGVRVPAEARLNAWCLQPGFTQVLLKLGGDPALDPAVRQSAVITLKNLVMRCYDTTMPTDGVHLNEDDRQFLRAHLVPVMLALGDPGEFVSVRKLLGVTLERIVRIDMPDQWPSLTPELCKVLQSALDSGSLVSVFNILFAYRYVIRPFQYRPSEVRRQVEGIVYQDMLPLVLRALMGCIAQETPLQAEIAYLACKIFSTSVHSGVPTSLLADGASPMQQWFTQMGQMMTRPLPQPLPQSLDEERSWRPYRSRKWALRVMERTLQRSVNIGGGEGASSPKQVFGKLFLQQMAPIVLKDLVGGLLDDQREGYRRYPDYVTAVATRMLDTSVQSASLFKVIKQIGLGHVITHWLWPVVAFTPHDHQTFTEDPQEFVRLQHSITAEYDSSRYAAAQVITGLVQSRAKAGTLNVVLALVDGHLQGAHLAGLPEGYERECALAYSRETALFCAGLCATKMAQFAEKDPTFRQSVLGLLKTFVIPLMLESAFPFLQARAVWCFAQFSVVEFGEDALELLQWGLQATGTVLLAGSYHPVVVAEGLIVLERLLQLHSSSLHPLLLIPAQSGGPIPLEQLLKVFFSAMTQFGVDQIDRSLAALIFEMQEEMVPYATGICIQLCDRFASLCKEEEEGDAPMQMAETLRALHQLLNGCTNTPQVFEHLEPILTPFLEAMLTEENLDLFDDLIELLVFLTFFLESIPPSVWNLWRVAVDALKVYAIDYLHMFVQVFDNYIARSTDVFLDPTRPYLEEVLDLAQLVLHEAYSCDFEFIPEQNARSGPLLLQSVLLNCRGGIDAHLDLIVDTALKTFFRQGEHAPKTPALRVLLLNVVINALYYNPSATLQLLEGKGAIVPFFSAWLELLPHFRRVHDKKLSILAILAILDSQPGEVVAVAPSIAPLLHGLFPVLLKLLHQLDAQKEALENEEEDEDDDDVELLPRDLDDDEDQLSAADRAFLHSELGRAKKRGIVAPGGGPGSGDVLPGEADEDDDDDDDDEDDLELKDHPNSEFVTVLDGVDEVIEFGRIARALEQSPTWGEALQLQRLSSETKAMLDASIALVHKRMAAAEAGAAVGE